MKWIFMIIAAFIFFTATPFIQPQNLILNPGCEDSLVNGEIPHWTEVVGTNWTHRENGNPPSFEGNYMFFPGVASVAELQQDIDVSSLSNNIDDGSQYFYFEGFVRVYNQNPPDRSRIILEYFDQTKSIKLDSIDLGLHFNVSDWVRVGDTTLALVGTRFIRIRLISTRYNGSNNDGYYDGLSLLNQLPVNISDNIQASPDNFVLHQNYPNPFNPVTRISWQSPVGGRQTLKVYDVLGNEVATLVDEYREAGWYEVEFNPASSIRHPASGIYLYQLRVGDFVQTKKMILLR